jgi:predicted nucleic acid-binding protein
LIKCGGSGAVANKLCIPDSDFLISLIKPDDLNHQRALEIYQKLSKGNFRIIYPISAIVEAATALSRRYNLPQVAKALLEIYSDPNIEIADIKHSEFLGSIIYFDPKALKQNTPFDCLILSIAKIKKAQVILSFDEFYKNKGLKTAWDLI